MTEGTKKELIHMKLPQKIDNTRYLPLPIHLIRRKLFSLPATPKINPVLGRTRTHTKYILVSGVSA